MVRARSCARTAIAKQKDNQLLFPMKENRLYSVNNKDGNGVASADV